MAFSDWSARLTPLGATAYEISSIRVAYGAMDAQSQAALDALVAGIASADLQVMLNVWRTHPASFSGFPGLAFGGHPAVLTGVAADDAFAVGAGTGIKLSVSAFTGTIDGGTP